MGRQTGAHHTQRVLPPDDVIGGKRSTRIAALAGPLLLCVLITTVYFPSIFNDFVYDDRVEVLGLVVPQSLSDAASVFTEAHYPGLPYYRPVTRASLVVDKYLFGQKPGPFLLVNVLLMSLAGLLVYGILRLPSLDLSRIPALLTAAIFALHPVASSAVYSISCRGTILQAVFTLLTLYAFMRHGRHWYAVALIALALALFAKEQAVVLPALLLLADATCVTADPPGHLVRSWLRRHGPTWLILLGYLVAHRCVVGSADVRTAVAQAPAGPLLSILYALQVTITPFVELVYEPPARVWMSAVRLAVCGLVVAVLVVCIVRGERPRRAIALFWGGWFLISLLPTANILDQEAHFAERYVFLSALGVVALAATAAVGLWRQSAFQRRLAVAAAVLVACCAGISAQRRGYFRSNEAFASQWLKTNPGAHQAHKTQGDVFAAKGMLDEAMACYRRSIEIEPAYDPAHDSLGNALFRAGRYEDAIREYEQALQIQPSSAGTHTNLGAALAELGRLEDAVAHHEQALRIRPLLVPAHNNLAAALHAQGKVDQAIVHYAAAVRIDRRHPEPHLNLARLYAAEASFEKAVLHYREALKLTPRDIVARNELAGLFVGQARFEEAIAEYQVILSMDPRRFNARFNMGVALARLDRLAEAATELQQVVRDDPADEQARRALDAINARLGEVTNP